MNIKKYLRSFVFNLTALWLATQIFAGVSITGGYKTLLLAALALTVVNIFVRPLIKLLFLPINLLTLGGFRWLVNVLALYLVTMIVPEFKIVGFLFPGYTLQGFIVPTINLGTFWVFVIISFFISLVSTFLFWLTK